MGVAQMKGTRQVTIELPEPVYRLLAHIADVTQQPLETLAAQSVTGNLPPAVESLPEAMRDDLLAMQNLPVEQLLAIAGERVGEAQAKRHMDILEQNSQAALTSEEGAELRSLRLAADRMMVRKAYAWALLRWQGYRVPSLDELPT